MQSPASIPSCSHTSQAILETGKQVSHEGSPEEPTSQNMQDLVIPACFHRGPSLPRTSCTERNHVPALVKQPTTDPVQLFQSLLIPKPTEEGPSRELGNSSTCLGHCRQLQGQGSLQTSLFVCNAKHLHSPTLQGP